MFSTVLLRLSAAVGLTIPNCHMDSTLKKTSFQEMSNTQLGNAAWNILENGEFWNDVKKSKLEEILVKARATHLPTIISVPLREWLLQLVATSSAGDSCGTQTSAPVSPRTGSSAPNSEIKQEQRVAEAAPVAAAQPEANGPKEEISSPAVIAPINVAAAVVAPKQASSLPAYLDSSDEEDSYKTADEEEEEQDEEEEWEEATEEDAIMALMQCKTIHPDSFPDAELLGKGAFGAVYKVYDPNLKKHAALKVFSEESSDKQMFDEMRLLDSMNHINIMKIHDCFLFDGRVCASFEYIDGITLRKLIPRRRETEADNLPEPIIAAIAQKILQGLCYLDKKNIIHRDLKSENIMVGRDGSVKIIDFGLAKKLTPGKSTAKGICGTPLWLAPEMLRKCEYTTKVDIYSFGIILVECVERFAPYYNLQKEQVYRNIATVGRPPLENPESVSLELQQLIEDATCFEPEERQDAASLLFSSLFMNTTIASDEELGEYVHQRMEALAM